MTSIKTINYMGIYCPCDIALYNKFYKIVLLSFYGSMSQIKAIFSAIVRHSIIHVNHTAIKRDFHDIKLKTWKLGHGKYHALIYSCELYEKTILVFNDEVEAWKRFYAKRNIPIIDEWIPKLKDILLENGHISALNGHGIEGYYWHTNDETVCDLIIENIYK